MSATDLLVNLRATREALAELAREVLADLEYMSRSHMGDPETPNSTRPTATGLRSRPRTIGNTRSHMDGMLDVPSGTGHANERLRDQIHHSGW